MTLLLMLILQCQAAAASVSFLRRTLTGVIFG
jgi:hypothetical protein